LPLPAEDEKPDRRKMTPTAACGIKAHMMLVLVVVMKRCWRRRLGVAAKV
jgi:hypothetical protein